MFRRHFLIGVGATLVTAGLNEACGGSPTTPGGVTPPPPTPQPPPTPPPTTPATIKITRILAFGDSMTAGTVSPALRFFGLDAGLAQSYPFKLQTMLTARYSAQTITVANAGWAGKNAWEDRSRLASSIRDASPELVLLMEGANDLNSIVGQPGTNAGVDATVGHMEDMVRDTVGRGIPVLLATLPPQRPPKGMAADLLPRYNAGLKTMAEKKGATLIDVNQLLPASLIGQDGLHPTEAGYQTLAEILFDAIKARYEVPPTE
jgi:lysophospholipase L1-like esterase